MTAPSYLSQQAYEPTGAFTPREGAARFDSNWTPVPSLAGLSAALDVAPEGRFERALEMAARCRELLGERVGDRARARRRSSPSASRATRPRS